MPSSYSEKATPNYFQKVNDLQIIFKLHTRENSNWNREQRRECNIPATLFVLQKRHVSKIKRVSSEFLSDDRINYLSNTFLWKHFSALTSSSLPKFQ